MSYHLAPIANQQQIDANGDPLSGGKIHTYIAGTSTPATTYTDDTGATAQANPIILNSRGVPASPVWLQGGRSYKLVITDANDVQVAVFDDVSGINDIAGSVDQWVTYANAPTYISATSFSVEGDQTPTFQPARRLKTVNTAGTLYSTVKTATYAAGITTITVVNDSGPLDSGLSTVSYGLLSVSNNAVPYGPAFGAHQGVVQSAATGVNTKINLQTEEFDTAGSFDSTTSRFTPGVAGYYQINAAVTLTGSPVSFAAFLYKNGAELKRGTTFGVGGSGSTSSVSALVYLDADDYIELYIYHASAGALDTVASMPQTFMNGTFTRAA